MVQPRVVKSLMNMEFDEVSLVDRPANQHASVSISKRAPEEDNMPDFYNEEGQLLSEDQLVEGATVYDEDGQAYELTAQEEDQRELAEVGKSAFFQEAPKQEVSKNGKSFSELVMEELSKADSDAARDEILSKALGKIEEQEQVLSEVAKQAKAERDLRLTREYIAKADEYNLPVAGDELGPVLYRMAETMSYDDCSVIHKALTAAGTALFQEIGYQGGGSNSDVMDEVVAKADELVAGSQDFSKADAVASVFDQNPAAYEQYLADRRGH